MRARSRRGSGGGRGAGARWSRGVARHSGGTRWRRPAVPAPREGGAAARAAPSGDPARRHACVVPVVVPATPVRPATPAEAKPWVPLHRPGLPSARTARSAASPRGMGVGGPGVPGHAQGRGRVGVQLPIVRGSAERGFCSGEKDAGVNTGGSPSLAAHTGSSGERESRSLPPAPLSKAPALATRHRRALHVIPPVAEGERAGSALGREFTCFGSQRCAGLAGPMGTHGREQPAPCSPPGPPARPNEPWNCGGQKSERALRKDRTAEGLRQPLRRGHAAHRPAAMGYGAASFGFLGVFTENTQNKTKTAPGAS